MKRPGFHCYVYDFDVDCNAVDGILDIHNYLMRKNCIV